MEDLFSVIIVIIVIIGVVGSIASSAKKAKARKAAENLQWPAAAAAPARKNPPPPAPAPQPMMPAVSFADAPGQVVTPTVHPHIQPDCETHDVPGSLGVTSTEGKDPCHEDQLTMERTFAEPVQEEGGLTFDWSGENMVKAFVMQEVLTRPVQRRAH